MDHNHDDECVLPDPVALRAELADGIPAESRSLDLNASQFGAPWELRAFATAVTAHREGLFPWDDFQQALISSIAEWEQDPHEPWSYYERWLEAFEQVVVSTGTLDVSELEDRTEAILAAPPNRDHQARHPDPIAVASARS